MNELPIRRQALTAHLTSIHEKTKTGNRLSLALLINRGVTWPLCQYHLSSCAILNEWQHGLNNVSTKIRRRGHRPVEIGKKFAIAPNLRYNIYNGCGSAPVAKRICGESLPPR